MISDIDTIFKCKYWSICYEYRMHHGLDYINRSAKKMRYCSNDRLLLNFTITVTVHIIVILKPSTKLAGNFDSTYCHASYLWSKYYFLSVSQFATMHLAAFQSCMVFSLIKMLTAGVVDEKRLVDHNTAIARADHGKVNSLRRRLHSLRGRKNQEEFYPVIIGVHDGSDELLENIFSRLSTFVRPKFKRINALSALVSQDELYELRQDPNIMYIEDDPMVYPDSGEATLYGLQMVQAFVPIPSKQNFTGTSTAACNNPNSFKIGIVDSGLAM